jgi:hypothetical protein
LRHGTGHRAWRYSEKGGKGEKSEKEKVNRQLADCSRQKTEVRDQTSEDGEQKTKEKDKYSPVGAAF